MKKLQLIIILIFFLLGCSEPYKSNGLFIEVTKDGFFVNKNKVDDIESFLFDVSDPEDIKVYLLIDTDVSARNVLHILDLSKEIGFKEISVTTPSVE